LFLSSLEILGFKSFARKTVFRFPAGITAIVGPNGCGKTNVVDAIRWVLGEQRAGVLRSERMENVIFNGSASAPPVGMAEVSITLQNTRNLLPIEFSEVKVTRRLFRSGESQYLLNDAPCRLKDIQNLFLDTGLAPDAYSVIELSMVEDIINGKADERRRILEEAAGVGKYKIRRRAALRKLEATEADLLRLNDLISEVERNVRSLQVQVRRAQRAQELRDELREKDLLLCGLRLHRLLSELAPLTEKLRKRVAERDRLQTRIELEESEIEQLRAELIDAETRLAEAQQVANQRSAHARALERRLLVLRERIRSTEESLARLARELTELEIRDKRIDQEKESTRQQIAQVHKRGAEIEHKLQRAEEERKRALRARDASRARLAQAEEGAREGEKHLAELEIEKQKLVAQLESLRRELERAQAELGQRTQEVAERRSRAETLHSQLQVAENRLRVLQKLRTELGQKDETTQTQLTAARKEEVRLAAELERARQHLASLERLLSTQEDRPEALRHLLNAPVFKGATVGLLADLVSVPEDLAEAIAAALGPVTHSLVVHSAEEAFEGIGLLRRDRKGTATFVPLKGRQDGSLQGRPNLTDHGVIGWADQWVKCETSIRPVVQAVLGRVLIVEDEEVARDLLHDGRLKGFTLVTRNGTVVRADGIVQGGHLGSSRQDIFDRRGKVETLRREVQRLEESYRHAQNRRSELEKEQEQLRPALAETERELGEVDREVGRLRLELEENERREREAAQIVQDREGRILELSQRVLHLEEELTEVKARQEELLSSLEERRQELERIRSAHEEKEKELQVSEGSYQQIRLERVRVATELENLRSQLERLERERNEVQELVKRRTQEQEELRKRLESTQAGIETAEQDLSKALERKEAAEAKVENAQRIYTERRNKIAQRQEKLRHLRNDLDQFAEEIHQLELKSSELRMRAENLKSRVSETWNTQLEPVDRDDLDLDALERDVQTLRSRLERMGPVNELAVEEFKQEKERLDFLTAQRDDLLQAKTNLLETIQQINRTARERFLETFETVRKNFTAVFQSFFEGGEADLRLTDPRDPLESEIEILARPRGKKVETLSLLSGGEKALTAISFLFAIYLVKPSPFCILDEVDAPLDDNNVENFVNALRKFSENTQFIIVTHNKLTMKAADALYGVTMQRDGVSKVVSVRFEEELVENAA